MFEATRSTRGKAKTMSHDEDAVVMIWSTWPDAATAKAAARALVEARLAACAVLLPGLASIYRWNGAIEEAAEVGLLVKTRAALAPATAAAIERDHPWEVPAVLTLTPQAVAAAYGAWVLAETAAPAT
jgi:periplasmic divalent cation tolerance protein